ncbi:MAG: MJ0042-type zinc finger domain-containing protein, partial [Pirellula sp.]
MSLAKLKTHCPHCQASFSVKQELHGRKAKCPSCGGRFLIQLNENEIKPSHARDSDEQRDTSEAQGPTLLSEGPIDPHPIDPR